MEILGQNRWVLKHEGLEHILAKSALVFHQRVRQIDANDLQILELLEKDFLEQFFSFYDLIAVRDAYEQKSDFVPHIVLRQSQEQLQKRSERFEADHFDDAGEVRVIRDEFVFVDERGEAEVKNVEGFNVFSEDLEHLALQVQVGSGVQFHLHELQISERDKRQKPGYERREHVLVLLGVEVGEIQTKDFHVAEQVLAEVLLKAVLAFVFELRLEFRLNERLHVFGIVNEFIQSVDVEIQSEFVDVGLVFEKQFDVFESFGVGGLDTILNEFLDLQHVLDFVDRVREVHVDNYRTFKNARTQLPQFVDDRVLLVRVVVDLHGDFGDVLVLQLVQVQTLEKLPVFYFQVVLVVATLRVVALELQHGVNRLE